MAHLHAAASSAHSLPTPPHALLRVTDTLNLIERPLMALQAVEQLTHPTHADSNIDLSMLDRTALGYLLGVIQQDFARVIEQTHKTIEGESV